MASGLRFIEQLYKGEFTVMAKDGFQILKACFESEVLGRIFF